jgi:hypothetical protein
VKALAVAAKALNQLGHGWLSPLEWSLTAAELKLRMLTNLYNQRLTWLDNAHGKLDEAVFVRAGGPRGCRGRKCWRGSWS